MNSAGNHLTVDHTTQVRRPQSNGFVERLHRTLLDEHFRIMGREKWYESVEAMQKGLDDCFLKYNTKRPHQGRNMNGRTPEKVFKEELTKIKKAAKMEPPKAA